MSTALSVVPRGNPFEPDSIPQALQLSDMLAKSALVPSSLRGKPADIFIILATAREMGIGPMQGLSDINVIQGKPVLSADLMIAQCKKHPEVCRYIRLVESTDTKAVYETHRVGSPEPETFTFTMDDAKKLGLDGKDNYRKQAKTMLRRRCAAMLARETYQDLVRGYDPDEAEDFARPVRQVEPEVVRGATVEATPPPRPALAPAAAPGPDESGTLSPGVDPPAMDGPPPEEDDGDEELDIVTATRLRIQATKTIAALLVVGSDIKKMPAEVRESLRQDYADQQAKLREAK